MPRVLILKQLKIMMQNQLSNLDEAGQFVLDPKEFPNMKLQGPNINYNRRLNIIRFRDKSGVAEIIPAMDYFIQHPEIKHGDIKIGLDQMKKSAQVLITSMLKILQQTSLIQWMAAHSVNLNMKHLMQLQ